MTITEQNFIEEIFETKEKAKDESYKYFHENIHPIERDEEGRLKVHNNDVDAFRHAYVSGVMTQIYGGVGANILGQLKEIQGDIENNQPPEEKNMDLWNNAVGRKYGDQTHSRNKLADLLKQALKNGELIITVDQNEDSREYGEEEYSVDSERPVIVVKEAEVGRNEMFLDVSKRIIMSRSSFVSQIEQGIYPGYMVAMINDLATPMSKPDGDVDNNLG